MTAQTEERSGSANPGTLDTQTTAANHNLTASPLAFDRGKAFDRLLAGLPSRTIDSLIKKHRTELDQLIAYRETFGCQIGQAPNLDAAIAFFDFVWCQLTLEAGARQCMVRP